MVGTNPDDSGGTQFAATLPVLGVLYALSPELHLYATAGRGFETPTLNELAYRPNGLTGLNLALQASRSTSAEVGAKARLGGFGELTAAVFETHTANEIATLSNVGGRATFQNVGATRRTGFELGWSATLAESLRAQAALAWLDARYTDGFSTCTVTPCVTPNQAIAAGNKIPGVAAASAFASLNWAPALGWRGGIEGRYLSRVYVNDANSDGKSDAVAFYFIASANVGYSTRVGPWELGGFARVDNLFDRQYIGSVIVNEGNSRFFEPAPGRTWTAGVSASYTF